MSNIVFGFLFNYKIKLALRSCHLLLIFIGDLERYIAQLQNENNYEHAILRYKQAQILVPKNGKSYNQLAVVAVVARRKLDAVYYYARSLQASNPILSAKDRLTAIFQEIKKKVSCFKMKSLIQCFLNIPLLFVLAVLFNIFFYTLIYILLFYILLYFSI